ncbi:hypothetical protein RB195_010401 [Necator americanus]|uniref:Uncharacterized protein n=1 Tax=Necator americanus TaxID=51031 RepID=A0ABR1CXR4_NECAM
MQGRNCGNTYPFRHADLPYIVKQTATSRLPIVLGYVCVSFVAVQEIRIRDGIVIRIGDSTIYRRDADEKKVRGCVLTVINEQNNLLDEVGLTSSKSAVARLRSHRECKLFVIIAHLFREAAEKYYKDAFRGVLNTLTSKIPSQQAVIVGLM